MPACVPINNNNVGDTNMVRPPTAQSDSKFSKIISCLFLKKKTDVVDMTKKETPTAAKKKKMAVDRSERSRRVLKMESMRAVPQSRDEPATSEPPSPAQNQMFLPSENPTASFLSYLDPSVRRACSDVIRTNSSASHARPVRQAFADGNHIHTRNTNYRGQQISENGRPGRVRRRETIGNSSRENDSDTPPALPPRNNRRQSTAQRAPVVVPGIMASSDDDMGYNSDGDISDLHDEMRRMNMNNGHSRENGHVGQRQREGSISLSEGSDPDEEILAVSERPNNPSPGGAVDAKSGANPDGNKAASKKTMEAVIDDLFQQTQNNIDTIYRNGLETMDIEASRPETATPETCMKRLEADLAKSQPAEESTDEDNKMPEENSEVNRSDSRKSNQHQHTHNYQHNPVENPNLDNLLTEVSIWAKDRQTWLLDCGNDPQTGAISRESTVVSMTTDGRVIEQVNKSNKDKCNDWVRDNDKTTLNYSQSEPKTNGLLTGPKLFRSALQHQSTKRVSFDNKNYNHGDTSGNSKQQIPETRKIQLPTKKHFGGVQIVDLAQDNDNDMKEVTCLDILGPYPEPWTADMYASSTTVGDRQERSTIDDDISEPDGRRKLRDRSPESWLSSNGSCSNLLNRTNTTNKDDDSFEFSTTPMTTPRSRTEDGTVKITASNIGKSHQIIRQSPKIHTPFSRSLERQPNPRQTNPIQTKPMLRNTQLKPLTVLRTVKPKNAIDSYPALPGMKNFIYEDSSQGFRNVHEEEMSAVNRQTRPFSEIPLRPDLRNNDRNSSILAHSSSLRDDLEQYGVAESITRPVSETLPAKRSDKIGVGPIMATKSKQTYARDVINAMERQRFKNNQEAFRENNDPENEDDSNLESSNNDKKEPENGKKRHKVFTNGLLRGGYSYDKHSRQSTAADKQSEISTSTHNQNNKVTASVNDLCLSMRDSTEQNSWRSIKPTPSPRTMQLHAESETVIKKSETPDEQSANNVTLKRGNIQSKSFNIKTTSNIDLKRGNVSTSFQNKYSLVQSHGLGGSQDTDSTTPSSADKTANKFRQIRNRRDQEMEWLMKDAAETEV